MRTSRQRSAAFSRSAPQGSPPAAPRAKAGPLATRTSGPVAGPPLGLFSGLGVRNRCEAPESSKGATQCSSEFNKKGPGRRVT